jgi:F0F1-type ATP synthase membrane subunit c/vacuolar-type H+-ATPase subunit K
MQNITIILVMLISTLGPAAVVAYVGYSAVRAVGRNPSAAPRILLAMVVAFIFAEAISIVSVLMLSTLFK